MKKTLSIILTLVMVIGVFTSVYVPVSAVDTEEPTTTEVTTTEPDVTEPDTSEPDTTDPAPAVPSAPVLNSVANDVGGVKVTWSLVEGITSYTVYRRAAGEADYAIIASGSGTSCLDTDVKNGVYYKYAVTAKDENGESVFSNEILVKYVETPKLTSIENVNDGIKIKWSSIDGATGYRVYRRAAGVTTWLYLGTVSNTDYTDTAVKNNDGEYYRYTVRGVSGYYSGFDTAGLYIKRIAKLATPKLTGAANVAGGVSVTWNAVSGATGYRVYRRGAGETYWTYLTTVTALSYKDTKVSHNNYYRYTVKASYGSNFSDYDPNGPVVRYIATPKLTGIANATNGIYVKWQTLAGATGYRVYRRGAGETTWTYLGTTTDYRYKDTTCVALNYYRYTVIACIGTAQSGFDTNGLVLKFTPLGTWDKDTTFNFYRNAINNARYTSKVGFTYKTWQNVKTQSTTGDNKEFVNEFKQVMNSSYYPSSNPFTYTCAKGSEDASLLFPYCGAYRTNIKSATCTKSGNNYVVTLVMADEVSPELNKYGVSAMSNNYFGLYDLLYGLKSEGLVTSGTTKSTYKNFTITAVITADGKIVSMTHSCKDVALDANMKFIQNIGNVKYKATVDTYVTYTNIKY